MQFSGKIGQIVDWRPLGGWHPTERVAPPPGNPGSVTAVTLRGGPSVRRQVPSISILNTNLEAKLMILFRRIVQ